MAENLKTINFYDSTPIPSVTNGSAWAALTTSGYCWYNNDSITYKGTYGALYNWYAVGTGKLCPTAWHVANDADWHTLILYLDANAVLSNPESWIAGGKLKESGTTHWPSPNTGATNESGFTALPGGNRTYNFGAFINNGSDGLWWSSSGYDAGNAWYRIMYYDNTYVTRNYSSKNAGLSVRCVKD
jgi:uncharacterized protein (TIGR02145 family)